MNDKNIDRISKYLDWLGFKDYDIDLSNVKDIFADIIIRACEDYRKCKVCGKPMFEGWNMPLCMCSCKEVKE